MQFPKLLVLDFDGVFTNGFVTYGGSGLIGDKGVYKSYNIKDGMGIKMLKDKGVEIGLITGFPFNTATKNICAHLKIDRIVYGKSDKLSVLKKWAVELNIPLSHVAYMGDDINDIKCMESVGISACPANASQKCIDICRYVCKSNGGDGAIREFAEYILNVVQKLRTISGLICVKLKSTRCAYKNIRRFGNSTLIDHKIKILNELKFLDHVVFNTDSQELIDYVSNKYSSSMPKLLIIKRDSMFASDEVENIDFCRNVTSNFPSECVLYSPVTMPFISTQTYQNMYNELIEKQYDSIVLAADGEQGGGHSNEKHKLCFAASMMSVKDVSKYGDFIGEKPYFQKCTLKERMDIDFPNEFNTALYHEFNTDGVYGSEYFKDVALYKMNELSKFDENKMLFNLKNNELCVNDTIQVIDVTTRDGGFVNDWSFTVEDVEKMLQCASDTGLDYFEIGYLMNQNICKPNDGMWRNTDFNLITNIVDKIKPKCKISAMIDYWRYDIEKLLPATDTNIDLIRITCYMHKIQECIDYCTLVHKKGYSVSLNVMCGSYFTDDVIDDVIEKISANKNILEFAYVADTYGAMNPYQVRHIYSKLVPALHKCGLKVGFHIHNNGHVAMANTFEALEQGVDIIDASYSGMGRGAGNLFLEFIVLHLATHSNYGERTIHKKLNIEPFLNFVHNKYLADKNTQQINNIKYALVGFFNAHPYRLRDFDENINLYDLYKAFEEMPVERKFDYLLG